MLAPLIQLALAGGAVALIVVFLEVLPLALLVVLLGVALLMGPIATLGLIYNVIGRSVLLEREKQSVRWQQGLLGLGLGTDELVPFWRIDHIAVEGDYEAELAGGETPGPRELGRRAGQGQRQAAPRSAPSSRRARSPPRASRAPIASPRRSPSAVIPRRAWPRSRMSRTPQAMRPSRHPRSARGVVAAWSAPGSRPPETEQ